MHGNYYSLDQIYIGTTATTAKTSKKQITSLLLQQKLCELFQRLMLIDSVGQFGSDIQMELFSKSHLKSKQNPIAKPNLNK